MENISGYSEAIPKNMENYLLKACAPDLEKKLPIFVYPFPKLDRKILLKL